MDPKPRRVKLYQLGEQSNWEDKGTGYCIYTESDTDDAELVVRSEEDSSLLLNSKIDKNRQYQKQQETLIVWTEENNVDLALSFQEPEGCAEIWAHICEVQKDGPPVSQDDYSDSPQSFMNPITLPSPELSNLGEIEMLLKHAATSVYEKDKLASFIMNENYIDKLLPVFETCEDLENVPDLHTLCNIMKAIILLNDNIIIEYIIKDEKILGVVGILEYDPDFPNLKANHRDYLANNTKFKQVLRTAVSTLQNHYLVVPIKDKAIESKIHQTFRLQYLKDVVLARTLEDSTFAVLNSLIFFNHVDIVNHLQHDAEFLKELFSILDNKAESLQRKRDVVLFVQQFCAIAKNLQMASRAGLYRALSHHGLFGIFEHSLADPDALVRMAGAEILGSILEHDPNLVKQDKSKKSLVETVIQRFIADPDLGMKAQFVEVIRTLLDTATGFGDNGITGPAEPMLHKPEPEAEEFLGLFYDNYIGEFVKPLMGLPERNTTMTGEIEELTLTRETSTLCWHICDTLCFAIKHHSHRSKYFFLSTTVSVKIAQLFRTRDKHLKLAAIRVFRTCVGLADEFYNRYLIKNHLLEPILRTYADTGNRNNLLNSTCLELFDYIRKENIKSLVAHLVTQYGEYLKSIDDVDTFRQLVKFHEKNTDTTGGTSSDTLSNSLATIRQSKEGWSSSTMDDDEEAYFNASDDDDNDRPSDAMNPAHKDTSGPDVRGITNPLVDYDDEEENDVSLVAGNNINKSVHDSPKRPPEKRARNDEDGEDDDLLARGGKQLAGNLGTRRLLLHGPKKLNIEPQPKKAKAED
ncbi:component of IIS longevity pathway SMK-1-domain-containing protein [Endogone sp. FLAS-F59071]|nr:component of IIS longevity pathway SMK-1-domain-containing protein [Endogone sp. FLAS-F59071]|eukprot:RUS19445.1 component of IIS longevity pathway SMK-1-domain-containing protein [Endogone sp. FLAS-F59071]